MSTPLARSLAELPPIPEDVRKWRILLLVSAANSLTQRVMTYLSDLGCEKVSTELALSDESMISAVLAHSPHVVLCPFLTKKVPDVIWENVLTLIVHPGPPGDAGPAAIDWAIMGDRGFDADAATALPALQAPSDRSKPISERQRSHWGITVLQADHTMDGGPVWAWDQFPLNDVARTTKSSLYQGPVTNATIRTVTVALSRIQQSYAKLNDPTHRGARVGVKVDPTWSQQCVSYNQPFMGGPLNERPQIKPGQRRPDLALHTAADVARLINCGDSQPGGTLKTTKSFMFAYDAHIHLRAADIPSQLIHATGHADFNAIPAGRAIATRSGAVLFKTADCGHGKACSYGCGVAVWFTHGRIPKAVASAALSAKVPMAEALVAAGEGSRLDGVPEWPVHDFQEVPGTWQQVFVRTIPGGDGLVQLVYWDFYNGAFSTTGCEHLVAALQWATDPARGDVKVLALMGGQYFSNGVALNIIESAEHPGRETWANINAIDDVVEFLAGDLSGQPRSEFLAGIPSLTERGITTVACLRGNAAAGGVALAAACDVVVSAGTVVLNPAYRAMGLHGSEFHLYSYVERCGRSVATHLVKDMLPLSAVRARELGLVDVVIGGRDIPSQQAEVLIVDFVRQLASAPATAFGTSQFASAPWTLPVTGWTGAPSHTQSLVARLCDNKRRRYALETHIPLVHYRHEELSQMLLDSFHPIRSQRYHTRRIKFVRKVKAEGTPTRYVHHRMIVNPDEEESPRFDDAPAWVRGEEWSWVGLQTPASMATSQSLLIDFAAPVAPLVLVSQQDNASSGSEPSNDIRTDAGSQAASPALIDGAEPRFNPPPSPSPITKKAVQKQTSGGLRELAEPVPVPAKSSFAAGLEHKPIVADFPKGSSRPLTVYPSGGIPHGSSLNVSPKRQRGSFLLKISNAFRSKSRNDLRTDAQTQANTRANAAPPSTATLVSSAGGSSEDMGTRSSRRTLLGGQPKYNRPVIPNEGDTESPCLFNVTADFPQVPERPAGQRPQVVAA